ncbi:MAG: PEP-CTERM sorting domain-containing protein [Azoarcus sp.]|nr:PEP-CTERM sorting domain-containing protein [Azoarcus sp.]
MNKKLCLFALPALFCMGVAQADDAFVVNFENGSAAPYFTYDTNMVGIVDGAGQDTSSGFYAVGGYSEGSNVAYPYMENQPSVFNYVYGDAFDLNSFVLGNVWSDNVTYTIEGFKDGAKVATDVVVTFTDTAAHLVTFDSSWQNIDSFSISFVNNSDVFPPNWAPSGGHWALDDISAVAVPEPETYAMLLAGLAVVGAVARRRRRA